jgi:hypothetical protein
MKKIFVAIVLGMLVALTGCKSELKKYVKQTVELKSVGKSNVMRGKLNFTKTIFYTEYEQVCDRVQCGVDHRTDCDYRTECRDIQLLCDNRGWCYLPDGHRICRINDSRCNNGYYYHCYKVPTHCWDVETPRYCDVNCRMEPVQKSKKQVVTSEVVATIKGLDNAKKYVSTLALGVKPTNEFLMAVNAPPLRPKDFSKLFDGLKATDRSFLFMEAKGYELTGSEFLALPQDFKAGDPLFLNVEVKPAPAGDKTYSAAGSEMDTPALEWNEVIPPPVAPPTSP